MSLQSNTCKNCQKSFEIREKDLAFYSRLQAPTPNYCPDCRMQRRLSFRNERTLYRRKCDLCKKESVSIYPAKTPWPMYCETCWNGDSWDAKDFGIAYDSSKPFFDQFKELQKKVPRIGLLSIDSVNSEFTNNSAYNKNCYLLFAAEYCEDSLYGRLVQRSKFVVDGAWTYDSELCYECIDCRHCYNCIFTERCQDSNDLLFCFGVRDSKNCILSTNLHHAEYMIENKQASPEEFEKRKQEILSSRESIEAARKHFEELKSQALVKFAFQTKCEDATGDYLHNCHEVNSVFDSTDAKACAYSADGESPIDCYDCNNFYYKPELCLDVMGTIQSRDTRYSTYVFNSNEIMFGDNLHNCNSCIGCIGLRKKDYCILNKEYSPEEYKKIKTQIIESLKKEGVYGDFLPPELSPFGYNETLAKDYYPITKDEAAQKSFRWQDETTGTTGKETVAKGSIPKTSAEISNETLKEVFVCENCGTNFKVVQAEIDFYKKMSLPLPVYCFECRHKMRVQKRNPRKLWKRTCMCDYKVQTNATKHSHHTDGQCPNEFETSYSPERKEVVYCEQCYQSEMA